jgi:hypothetical protein
MPGSDAVTAAALWTSLDQDADMTCPEYFSKCANKECIQTFKFCDSKVDCKDGSDEIDCGGML